MSRRVRSLLLAASLVALAGCGTTTPPATETPLTPVAVPTDPPAAATDRSTAGPPTPNASVAQPRYLRLRPTCERPPGLVVAIQVGALRNDPPNHEGINTTWQFAAPGTQRTIGSLDRFVDVVEGGYRPLLEAETVTYGPLDRGDGTASRRVTVRSGNRTTTYRWELELRTGGPHEGCWLTTAVTEVEGTAGSSPQPVGGLPRP
jgi:predicted small lipoprotein YifL